MIRSDELEFEFEDEAEYELEHRQSGMIPGPLPIQVVYDYTCFGYREFEYEDEGELFDPAPPPRPTVLLTRFAFGSSTLTAEHRRMIPRLAAAVVRGWPRDQSFCWNVSIVGHEDEVGDPDLFCVMGQRRAQAVFDALLAQLKRLGARIPAASRPKGRVIFTVGSAGPTRPIRSNVTAQGQASNRRVEVLGGRPDVCPDVA